MLVIRLNQAVSSIKKRAAKVKASADHQAIRDIDGIVFDLNQFKRQKEVSNQSKQDFGSTLKKLMFVVF